MTEQQFIKKTKMRIALSVLFVLAGSALLIIPKESISGFVSGYQYGLAGGLLGAGIATIVKNIIFLKNEKIRQREYIKQSDERNILISKKALGLSWFITLLLLGITPLFLSAEAAKPLLCIMGISAFSYAISYWIWQKKM